MNDERMSSRNRLRSTAVAGGLMSVAVLSVSSPALADDIGRIVKSLESSNVYQSLGAKFPEKVSSVYSNENIAIVYNEGASDPGAEAVAISSQTDYDTVIVYSGTSFGASSTNGNGSEIASVLNSSGDGVNAVVSQANQVKQLTIVKTGTSVGTNPPITDSGIGIGAGIGLGLGAVLILTVGIVLVKKLFGKKGSDEKPVKDILPKEYFDNVSQKLGQEVGRFRELIVKHENSDLPLSVERMKSVDKRLGDLFSRLSRKGTQDQVHTAAIKYQNLLKKVIYIMDEDHYMDLAKNPELWNHAERRKQDSLNCVEAVDKQILDNIKQVNDSQDLEFNITMQALLSDSDDMDEIEELLFKNDDSYRIFGK